MIVEKRKKNDKKEEKRLNYKDRETQFNLGTAEYITWMYVF